MGEHGIRDMWHTKEMYHMKGCIVYVYIGHVHASYTTTLGCALFSYYQVYCPSIALALAVKGCITKESKTRKGNKATENSPLKERVLE